VRVKKSWLIDTDVLIEGERGNPAFLAWLAAAEQRFATADIVRGQFLVGVHAVKDVAKKNRGLKFYSERIAALSSLSNQPEDYERAAMLVGEACKNSSGAPDLADGLLAAIALRTGAIVATRNVKDFKAMGCPCKNPLG
jgi:predicted nucleic acid-binding protein